jgi:hypothetical protein
MRGELPAEPSGGFSEVGVEANPEGDFFVRSGPGTVKLSPENTKEYIRTRFGSSPGC